MHKSPYIAYPDAEMAHPHSETSEPGTADPDTQLSDPHAEMSEPGTADPDMHLTDPDTEMPDPHAETSEPGTADPDTQLTDPDTEMPGPHAETSEPGAADPDTQLTHPDAEMPYRLTEMLDPHAEMSEPGAADPDTQVTDADTEMPDRLTEMLDPHAEMSEPGAADPDMPLTDPDTEMPGPHAETSEPGTADPDIQLTDPHSERAAGTTEIVPVEIAESEIVPPSVSGDSEVIPIYALPCLTEKTAPMSVVEKVNHWTVSDSGAVTIDDPNPGSCTSGNCNILIYTKDANTKGKNRKLPCFYCGIFVYQMNRHLLRKHGNEPQVAAASANSIGRTLRLQKIVNQGLYKHNVEVLRNRDGVLIVGRSPKAKHTCDDFLPCEFCLHFFIKRELYRHSIRCKFRQADGPTT